MNAAELRYRLVRALNREPGIDEASTVSPVPGQPLTAEVTVQDPFTARTRPEGHSRRFKITIEEID